RRSTSSASTPRAPASFILTPRPSPRTRSATGWREGRQSTTWCQPPLPSTSGRTISTNQRAPVWKGERINWDNEASDPASAQPAHRRCCCGEEGAGHRAAGYPPEELDRGLLRDLRGRHGSPGAS